LSPSRAGVTNVILTHDIYIYIPQSMLSGALLYAAEGTVDRMRYSMVSFPSTDRSRDSGQIWEVGHCNTCCLSLVLPYDVF
jgi:hypothetical protein